MKRLLHIVLHKNIEPSIEQRFHFLSRIDTKKNDCFHYTENRLEFG